MKWVSVWNANIGTYLRYPLTITQTNHRNMLLSRRINCEQNKKKKTKLRLFTSEMMQNLHKVISFCISPIDISVPKCISLGQFISLFRWYYKIHRTLSDLSTQQMQKRNKKTYFCLKPYYMYTADGVCSMQISATAY